MVNKISSYQTAENGKFIEIVGNTQYPAISVVRWSYPDTSDAFAENAGLPPVSSVDVYSKYAVLVQPIGVMEQLTTITNVLCAILAKP